MTSSSERYSRQILFAEFGEDGQSNLRNSSVLVCGCGALGTVLAETMARAGVGKLRIVDRDFVEISNLQRQVLFDEDDVEQRLPKAVAAAKKLEKMNSDVDIEAIVADIDHTNILSYMEDVDLVLDGTDNFEVRFLINDAALETKTPWIYGGCIGVHGQTMAIFPGESACLRCLIETVPDPGTTETCDTAGILGPTVNIVASLQCVDALKILAGRADAVAPALKIIDVWDLSFRSVSVADLRERSQCAACVDGRRDWLNGERTSRTTSLCGRNAVQVAPAERLQISFDELAEKLKGVGRIETNPYLLRLSIADEGVELTVFRDGRAIIHGTDDESKARGLFARYVGS